MSQLIFSTTNLQKFILGSAVLTKHKIKLTQNSLEIDEVQSENAEYVITSKAAEAFKQLGQPVIVSDDSWALHGLNGFPGTYMKSINEWFSDQDFIHLTKPLKNKAVTFSQLLCYQDKDQHIIFRNDTPGVLLNESRGISGVPCQRVISFNGGKSSIAEDLDAGVLLSDDKIEKIWHDFAAWFTKGRK